MMDAVKRLSISAHESGSRLDLYVCQSCEGLSRSFVHKLIDDGLVLINGDAAKPSRKVKVGDVILVHVPPPEASEELVPEGLPLDILYEDGDVVVVNKPAGLTVYPAPGHPRHTLMNAILAHCPEITSIESSVRPGVVHRLDKDTSGVMVIAKNKATQLNLASQIKNHRMLKKYLVLVKPASTPQLFSTTPLQSEFCDHFPCFHVTFLTRTRNYGSSLFQCRQKLFVWPSRLTVRS